MIQKANEGISQEGCVGGRAGPPNLTEEGKWEKTRVFDIKVMKQITGIQELSPVC